MEFSKETAKGVFDAQLKAYVRVGKSTVSQRRRDLRKLEKAILHRRLDLCAALWKDFKKGREETLLTEIFPLLSEIRRTRKNLGQWMRPQYCPPSLLYLDTSARIHVESKGVCLIIAPWNYPILLSLGPLVSAVAAGNTVILKPSEHTPHTSILLDDLLAEVFEEDHVAVVRGGAEGAAHLTALPFHHIFFTGSTKVGKKVMEAAASNLSSVTLELGGKSPVVVGPRAHVHRTAQRIAWGKLVNNGQTCIAPDYLIVHEDIADELIKAVQFYYGKMTSDKEDSPRCAIVHEGHVDRLRRLGDGAFPPTGPLPLVVKKVGTDHPAMKEEIFGPFLPILTYREKEDILYNIRRHERPLVVYLFDRGKTLFRFLLSEVRTGAVVYNQTLVHFSHPHLPFGGVNGSGMGRSHGYDGFVEFSNVKSVLVQKWPWSISSMVYPPYSRWKRNTIDLLIRYFK